MRRTYRLFALRGIDINIHLSWPLAVLFIAWSLGDYYAQVFTDWSQSTAYVVGAISAVLLFVTVLIHELAHSFTARAHDVPVHRIDLFIFGGVSYLTDEPKTPQVELLVALAGPVASLLLAGVFYALHRLAGSAPSEVGAVLGYLASINLLLALFNLIPGFPLDGGRVLRALIWMRNDDLPRATHTASEVGSVISLIFVGGGILMATFLGDVLGGAWLAIIGIFLHNAAGTSGRQAKLDTLMRGTTVRQVMEPPSSVTADRPLLDLTQRAWSNGNGTVLVTGEDGRFLGLVALRDMDSVPSTMWGWVPVTRIMTAAAGYPSTAPGDDLRSATRTLGSTGLSEIPVVEDGRLVGRLGRGQIMRYLELRRTGGVLPES